eukprot:CFRG8435T1
MTTDLNALVERLERAVSIIESFSNGKNVGRSPAASGSAEDSPCPSVEAFDEIISNQVQAYVALSDKIGGEVAEQAKYVKDAFSQERAFLAMAAKSKMPSEAELPALLKPTADAMGAVSAFKDAPEYRRSKMSNHLATVAEGINALGWISLPSKPGPYCKDMSDAGEFYGNRVIKDFKDIDMTHVEWARAFKAIWAPVVEYIMEYHKTKLTWNPKGGAASLGSSIPKPAVPARKSGGAPPPPPSAPPALDSDGKASIESGSVAAKANIFAELNKGGAVTAGLKKVDRSQMTHKNPELRASSVVKAVEKKDAPKPSAPSKVNTGPKKGTPKCELEGKKWVIEHYDNNKEIVIDAEMSQVVYIYKCNNCVIKVNGKVNSIAIDGCKKTGVVFGTCVSGVELVTCQSVQVQATGTCPTISIDKTDGVQVYLSETSLDTQVISAKSSEMNIIVPGATEDDDMVETPIVEQFLSTFNPKTRKWTTTTLESLG